VFMNYWANRKKLKGNWIFKENVFKIKE